MFFRQRYQFFDKNGNFISKPFLDIAQKARKSLGKKKTGTDVASVLNLEINIGVLPKKEVWLFINKLGSFLNSGVDLKSAVALLYKQTKKGRLRLILATLRTNLEYGLSLSETLRQYSKDFEPLVIALVEIGEKTGSLPKILIELDKKLLETIELKRRIKSAMIYPAILVLLTIVMIIFMMTFIIPRISETFIKAGVDLPKLTQIVIGVSDFIRNHYIILAASVLGIYLLGNIFARTRIGRDILDAILLKLPVFGFIVRMGNIITFINSLSLLLDSGILMLEALETTINTVGNIHFKRDIARIKNEVETGIKLSTAMGLTVSNRDSAFSNPYFPEELVHMTLVGEETGTIGKTIERVGQNYSKELKAYIGNLMAALEPFILVFVGSLVGVILIAIMLPFFNMGKVIQKSG